MTFWQACQLVMQLTKVRPVRRVRQMAATRRPLDQMSLIEDEDVVEERDAAVMVLMEKHVAVAEVLALAKGRVPPTKLHLGPTMRRRRSARATARKRSRLKTSTKIRVSAGSATTANDSSVESWRVNPKMIGGMVFARTTPERQIAHSKPSSSTTSSSPRPNSASSTTGGG